jgi:hypothetical protein
MAKIKLMEIEPLLNILNPIFEGKCGGLLSLEVTDLISVLEEELDKLVKVRTKLIETYAEKDENGEYKTIKNEQGLDIHTFGEDTEKVNKELTEVMEQEIEINKVISGKNFDNDVRIRPLELKFLKDKGILII